MTRNEEARKIITEAPARIEALQAEGRASMRKILDAKAAVEAAQMRPPGPETLTLVTAANAILAEAEAQMIESKRKLEEFMAEIRGLMRVL